MTVKPGVAARFLQMAVRGYQIFISPLTGPHCRFYPSCSHYAHEAFSRHGALMGLYLTLRRLVKCHPFTKSGFHDPVPDQAALTIDWQRLIRYNRLACKNDTHKEHPEI